jgi:Domain of unknown function (DUF4920)
MTLSALALSFALVTAPGAVCDGCKGEGKDKHAHKDGDACEGGAKGGGAGATAAAKPATGEVLLRGDKLKGAQKVALTDLLAKPAALDGKTVQLEGKVRKACERKGCWMELASADKGPGVRVTFKDYGFFVPLDSAGSTARVEGVVKVAALSDEAAKHLESEGATIPRGKDGKPQEVQLVAAGVELTRK